VVLDVHAAAPSSASLLHLATIAPARLASRQRTVVDLILHVAAGLQNSLRLFIIWEGRLFKIQHTSATISFGHTNTTKAVAPEPNIDSSLLLFASVSHDIILDSLEVFHEGCTSVMVDRETLLPLTTTTGGDIATATTSAKYGPSTESAGRAVNRSATSST
jgi:hypothetical protein